MKRKRRENGIRKPYCFSHMQCTYFFQLNCVLKYFFDVSSLSQDKLVLYYSLLWCSDLSSCHGFYAVIYSFKTQKWQFCWAFGLLFGGKQSNFGVSVCFNGFFTWCFTWYVFVFLRLLLRIQDGLLWVPCFSGPNIELIDFPVHVLQNGLSIKNNAMDTKRKTIGSIVLPACDIFGASPIHDGPIILMIIIETGFSCMEATHEDLVISCFMTLMIIDFLYREERSTGGRTRSCSQLEPTSESCSWCC